MGKCIKLKKKYSWDINYQSLEQILMQLDKSERFKHRYVVRETTYNHIAKRPLFFVKSQFLYMYLLVPCFRL